ncbi:MAG TPA: membrane protein insertion efficiency factor YidD [candidate division Zixibacteria bacterium]|nr:membrane protein insertion efficiency factor YidD [candidate division Zixibacteria bacterium]
MNRRIRSILAAGLKAYHRFVSPVLPRSCRFFPTCSVYASQAVERYGVVAGTLMALRRLGRCHPGNPGGYDPVR